MRLGRLNGLVAFAAVAERRGFSAAARVLGVSPSALSQAVRALEERVGTPLLVRTTRSVNVTDAGARLLERAAPHLREAITAMDEVTLGKDEVAGRLRLSVPRDALPVVVEPVLPRLAAAHPRLAVEVSVEDRLVDVVREGHDAGIRLSEAIEKDMIAVRVTPPFRFVVVGSPGYLARAGEPMRPRDLLQHACIRFRSPTTGALYAWELERGGREWELAVDGPITTNDGRVLLSAAREGLGLAYVSEHAAAADVAAGRLRVVLAGYAAAVPGYFLYFAARAREQPKLRALVAALRAGRG